MPDGVDLAFDRWVISHEASLLRFAYFICGGDRDRAQDVIQNSLTKIWRHWDRFSEMDAQQAYARRVIVREHVSIVRRMRERPARSFRSELVLSDPAEQVQEIDRVWSMLRLLPPRQQAVLALRFVDEMDDRQIADLLGIRPTTVRSQAARGLASLRQTLNATDYTHSY